MKNNYLIKKVLSKKTIIYSMLILLGSANTILAKKNPLNFRIETNPKSVNQTIKGTVLDESKSPLVGVSILIKATRLGTVTDGNGKFSLSVPDEKSVLIISMIGYTTQEVVVGNQSELNITLVEDIASLDQVVVTGVLDKRTRMESSVAISVINSKQIEMQAPTSASEILKNIPGIFVNSAAGEIKNEVSSRGFAGVNGYYYVSMQEDGLPVTGAQYSNYAPDFFLRPDLTLGKLEAVRGGTASILGNNAPGGIFNYVSKTGTTDFKAEVRAKYGLEGNKAANPYYRVDGNVSGAIGKSNSLFFNIGGFYRENDGPRYSGYSMNNGGQFKANIVKNTGKGTLKLYVKYLNDKNSFNDFLPTVDFSNPRLAPGVTENTSFLLPPIKATYYLNESQTLQSFNSADKIHNKEMSIGLNSDFDLGSGWTIDNKIRASDKSSYWNTTQVPFPFAVDGVTFYGLNGLVSATGVKTGNYAFADAASGQNLLNVVLGVGATGLKFTPTGALPGAEIQKNSLIFNPLVVFDNQVKELIDQLTINKKVGKMNFTGGLYYVGSTIARTSSGAGTAFTQMRPDYPAATTISVVLPNGTTQKLTNADGVVGGSGKSNAASLFDVTYKQAAAFLGHSWEVSPKFNFDWGIRFESIRTKGTNQIGTTVQFTDGGADKDVNTLYDNNGGKITSKYDYDKTVKTTSFSTGLNYKINNNLAFYGRYSLGKKAPDASIYMSVNTASNSKFLNPIAQSTQMYEIGAKIRKDKMSLFITPFYSILGNVPIQAYGQETADINSSYSTDVAYNKSDTKGIELEGNYTITKNVGIRGSASFSKSKALDSYIWNLRANGKADDLLVDVSGNENTSTLARISPYYNSTSFFASIDWTYMGKRPANGANAFYLPAYNQSSLNVGYNVNKHFTVQANINNLFNNYGVMGWAAPGGFPAALNTDAVTPASIAANPNAIFSTTALQPRAYYFTLGYKF